MLASLSITMNIKMITNTSTQTVALFCKPGWQNVFHSPKQLITAEN